jgi:hypothetical protein
MYRNTSIDLEMPLVLQEAVAPRIYRKLAFEGANLSALSTGHSFQQKIYLVLISV